MLFSKSVLEICQSLFELINAAARINKCLFSGKERMAFGANINSLLAALGGHGFNHFTTSAPNDALFVIRMDSFFHVFTPRFHKFDVL